MATDGANEDREPLKYFPDVGDTVKDDTLRKFSDPIGAQYRGSDARDAIESFLRVRAGELKSGDLDLMSLNRSGEYVGHGLKEVHIIIAERTLASCMRAEHAIGT